MARQRLGQHFLSDLQWREQIARAIRVSPHSSVPLSQGETHCWIEIGAGHGEMTQNLVLTGDPVYAVEIDPSCIAALQLQAKKFRNLEVVQGDILEADLPSIAQGRQIRIYGNLPYNITSPILHRLFHFANQIDEIHIVVQAEVARRLTAEPGTRNYGYLSVLTQLYSRPEMVFEIPRQAFQPPPEITSALVTLRLTGAREKSLDLLIVPTNNTSNQGERYKTEAAFLGFVKLCFAKKRKTLLNNLRGVANADAARDIMDSLSIRLNARAEQLSVAELATLYRKLTLA
jgi:16S rRNA (adenine1518-N6/adenine1519-N6)-dimethyltransferase